MTTDQINIVISPTEWAALTPSLIVAGTALLVMLADLVPGVRRGMLAALSLLGILAAAGWTVLLVVWPVNLPQGAFYGMIGGDSFAYYLTLVLLAGGGLSILVSADYLRRTDMARPGEYYTLLLSAVLGMILLATARHFMVIFLGLELLSLALYILAGFVTGRSGSREAGLKYFMLSSFATAFLLYGIALIYGATGSTGLRDIAAAWQKGLSAPGQPTILYVGAGMVAAGLGFKVSAIPFHMWTPDVYQGSPAPVSLLMSVGTKTAAFAAIFSGFNLALAGVVGVWLPIMWAMAVLTMVGGNLLALAQSNLKRLLAYSSIAHAGYVLVAVCANSADGVAAAIYYLAAYTVMNAGAFAVAAALEQADGGGTEIAGLRGLAGRRPGLAAALAVSLLSLTGIPPLAGFFGKLSVFAAAFQSGHAELAVIGLLVSAVSAFYYLRIVAMLYQPAPLAPIAPHAGVVVAAQPTSLPLAAALTLTSLGTVLVGLLVGYLLDWAHTAAVSLLRG